MRDFAWAMGVAMGEGIGRGLAGEIVLCMREIDDALATEKEPDKRLVLLAQRKLLEGTLRRLPGLGAA